MKSKYISMILFSFFILIFSPSLVLSAEGVADNLKSLQERLGDLKINLTELKKNLGNLGDKISGGTSFQDQEKKKEIERWLYDYAEVQGYGYKTGNLEILKKFTEELNKNKQRLKYSVYVPLFKGISDIQIKEFLKNKGVDVEAEWMSLINKIYPTEAQKKDTFNTSNLTQEFWNEVEKFKTKIEDIFLAASKSDVASFSFDNSFHEVGVDNVIKETAEKGRKLMVRSTGKEDTDKLANAGGNESVANVSPDSSSILKSMGVVVASYVGRKSLEQRLQSGDRTIFDVPFMPVLIQRMVGENVEESMNDFNKIPVCGVMFTEDPEGGISKLQDRGKDGELLPDVQLGRVKTSGITLVQASYGHNEGVVNSIVAVDSYYISSENEYYSVIKPKKFRLVPSKNSGKLEACDNPSDFVYRSVLFSPKIIKIMKELSDALELHYKKPMDIEFMIDRSAKAIFIVQARPIVHPESSKKASYIANLDVILAEKKAKAYAIGIAGGAVRVLLDRKNYIVKNEIGEALTEYLALSPERKNGIECIIIKKMAPSTSHEATSFRTFLKPVVYTEENFDKISGWVNTNKKLLVDVQQEVIIEATDIDFHQTGFLIEGNKNYPAPELVSLIDVSTSSKIGVTKELILQKIASFLKEIEPNEAKRKAFWEEVFRKEGKKGFAQLKENVSLKEILNKLEKAPQESQARDHLFKIVIFVSKHLLSLEDRYYDEGQLKDIDLFIDYFIKSVRAVRTYVSSQKGDALYQRKLLALRYLRALLYQQVSSNTILGGISFTNLLKGMFEEKQIEKNFNSQLNKIQSTSNKKLVIQLLRARKEALTDSVKNKWSTIVLDAQDKLSELAECVFLLSKLKVLSSWMTAVVGCDDINKEKLLGEYNAAKKFLQEASQKQYEMDIFEVALWEDPKKFESQFTKLISLVSYFTSDDFKQEANKNRTASLVASKLMGNFVDLFDLSLKSLKSSNNYDLDNKLARFKVLLNRYGDLVIEWLPFYKEIKADPSFTHNQNEVINFELTKIEVIKKFTNEQDPSKSLDAQIDQVINDNKGRGLSGKENLLNPSKTFDISISMLGSGAKFLESDIRTYEDYFTFFHQNLLAILGEFIKQKVKIPKDVLPLEFIDFINNYIEVIDTHVEYPFEGSTQKVTLIGIDIDENGIVYNYNYPLRSHSATLIVSYDKKTKRVECGCFLFGQNEYGRWDKIADVIEAMSISRGLKYDISLKKKSVFFEWVIKHEIDSNGQETEKSKEDKRLIIKSILLTANVLTFATGKDVKHYEDRSYKFFEKYNQLFDGVIDDVIDDGEDKRIVNQEAIKKVLNDLLDLSLGTKGRVHWFVLWLLKEYPSVLDDQIVNKIIEIIKKLCNDNDYAIATELFDFKIVHSPTQAGNDSMKDKYYDLEPTVNGFYKVLIKLEGMIFFEMKSFPYTLKDFYRKTAKELIGFLEKYTGLNQEKKQELQELKVLAQQEPPQIVLSLEDNLDILLEDEDSDELSNFINGKSNNTDEFQRCVDWCKKQVFGPIRIARATSISFPVIYLFPLFYKSIIKDESFNQIILKVIYQLIEEDGSSPKIYKNDLLKNMTLHFIKKSIIDKSEFFSRIKKVQHERAQSFGISILDEEGYEDTDFLQWKKNYKKT